MVVVTSPTYRQPRHRIQDINMIFPSWTGVKHLGLYMYLFTAAYKYVKFGTRIIIDYILI